MKSPFPVSGAGFFIEHDYKIKTINGIKPDSDRVRLLNPGIRIETNEDFGSFINAKRESWSLPQAYAIG